eukprot:tig00021339_g20408.t1
MSTPAAAYATPLHSLYDAEPLPVRASFDADAIAARVQSGSVCIRRRAFPEQRAAAEAFREAVQAAVEAGQTARGFAVLGLSDDEALASLLPRDPAALEALLGDSVLFFADFGAGAGPVRAALAPLSLPEDALLPPPDSLAEGDLGGYEERIAAALGTQVERSCDGLTVRPDLVILPARPGGALGALPSPVPREALDELRFVFRAGERAGAALRLLDLCQRALLLCPGAEAAGLVGQAAARLEAGGEYDLLAEGGGAAVAAACAAVGEAASIEWPTRE